MYGTFSKASRTFQALGAVNTGLAPSSISTCGAAGVAGQHRPASCSSDAAALAAGAVAFAAAATFELRREGHAAGLLDAAQQARSARSRPAR